MEIFQDWRCSRVPQIPRSRHHRQTHDRPRRTQRSEQRLVRLLFTEHGYCRVEPHPTLEGEALLQSISHHGQRVSKLLHQQPEIRCVLHASQEVDRLSNNAIWNLHVRRHKQESPAHQLLENIRARGEAFDVKRLRDSREAALRAHDAFNDFHGQNEHDHNLRRQEHGWAVLLKWCSHIEPRLAHLSQS